MAALLGVSTAACVIRMPPPPTPTRRAPSATLPSQPPPAGEGRIVLETLDGPAVAHLLTSFHVPMNFVLRHAEVVLQYAADPKRSGLLIFGDAEPFPREVLRLADSRIDMVGKLGMK